MKQTRVVSLVFACIFPLFTEGCLIAGIGAGVGAMSYGSSKKKKVYQEYVVEMEKINLEREKSELETRTIMTYKEWAKGVESENAESSSNK